MATEWVKLTAVAIEGSLSDGELSEYRRHCATLKDPLPEILSDVENLARGYLANQYALVEKGIPAELRAPCIDIAIYRLAKRARLAGDDDRQRKRAADDAMKILESAGKGEFGDFETTGSSSRSGNWGSRPAVNWRA